MAFGIVQKIGTDAQDAAPTVSGGAGWAAPSAGNVLIAAINAGDPSISLAGWTQVVNMAYQSSTRALALFSKTATGSETSIVAALGASAFWAMCALEVSGISTLIEAVIADTNSSATTSGLTSSSPAAGSFVFGAQGFLFNTVAAGSGFTALVPSNQAQMYWGTSFGQLIGVEYESAPGGSQVEATFTLSDSHGAAALVAAFSAAVAGPTLSVKLHEPLAGGALI